MNNFKPALLASLVLGAAVSNAAGPAFIFDFSSIGSFSRAAGTYTVADTVLPGAGSDFSTLPVASVSYNYSDMASTSGSGMITLVDASTINFSFNGSIIPQPPRSNALNGAVVSFSGGTGNLAGLMGQGNISNTLRWTADPNQGTSRTTFYGELEPVPEPASMAALALGVGALIRRRKNSK